jgi:hypothetical protein
VIEAASRTLRQMTMMRIRERERVCVCVCDEAGVANNEARQLRGTCFKVSVNISQGEPEIARYLLFRSDVILWVDSAHLHIIRLVFCFSPRAVNMWPTPRHGTAVRNISLQEQSARSSRAHI